MLGHDELAGEVLPALTRHADWETLPQVLAFARKHPAEPAVRSYLEACPKPAAKKFLKELGEKKK